MITHHCDVCGAETDSCAEHPGAAIVSIVTRSALTDAQIETIGREAATAGDLLGAATAARALGEDYSQMDLTVGERARVDAMTAEQARAACERTVRS